MNQGTQFRNRLVIWALFGSLTAYCVYGAVVGDLYIPNRRSEGGMHLSGLPAWVFSVCPFSMLFSLLVREGMFDSLKPRMRTTLEFALLFIGIGSLYWASTAGSECNKRSVASKQISQVAVTQPIRN